MRILSVDWDFFINVTEKERLMFPDSGSENFTFHIGNAIWSFSYANSVFYKLKRHLNAIDIEYYSYNLILQILKKQYEDRPTLLTDSHRHMYNFIKDLKEEHNPKEIEVYNVDYHHDCYNVQEDVNCGNWLRRAFEHKLIDRAYWIHTKASDTSCGALQHNFNYELNKTDNLEDIKDIQFDAIYICKSSMWSPPHLDKFLMYLIQQGLKDYRYITKKDYITLNERDCFYVDINRYILISKEIETRIKESMTEKETIKKLQG